MPAQYIAKLYTEGLGRAPDQPGWNAMVAEFDAAGCSVDSLERLGKRILEGNELMGRWGRDPYALAEIAFRAVLNREADPGGYSAVVDLIRSRGWDRALTHTFRSAEFGSLSTQICSTTRSSYGFNGSTGVLPTGVNGPITVCTTCMPVRLRTGAITPTEAELRVLSSTPGQVIELAPRSVIMLTQPLTLAPGVTIETAGTPGPRSYLEMARLVRNFATEGRFMQNATVVLQQQSTLRSVWVSGQRSLWRNKVSQSIDGRDPTYSNPDGQVLDGDDVRTLGGDSTSVLDNRLDDAPGWTTLELLGGDTGAGCSDNFVTGNLIEAYSSTHLATTVADQVTPWTDGMSVHCQGTTVNMNQIVDASDVPLILFNTVASPWSAAPRQHSQLSSNVIVSAGNSAYAALATDPGVNPGGKGDPDGGPGSQDFTGSVIGGLAPVPLGSNPTAPGQGNLLWNGPRTHFNVVVSDGTIAFFGPSRAYLGHGAAFIGNTTGLNSANAAAGIVVSGMMDTRIQGNSFDVSLIPLEPGSNSIWRCENAQHQVEWDFPARASGDVQGNPVAVAIPPPSRASCIVPGT